MITKTINAAIHLTCYYDAYNARIYVLIVLYMEPDWDCLDLLNAASQRLDMVPAARRIFNVDGTPTACTLYVLYHPLSLCCCCRVCFVTIDGVPCTASFPIVIMQAMKSTIA